MSRILSVLKSLFKAPQPAEDMRREYQEATPAWQFPEASSCKVGTLVVYRGIGPGQVSLIESDRWEISFGEGDSATVPSNQLAAYLRSPMSVEEANEVLEVLSNPSGVSDPRPWGEQYLEHQHILREGTPTQQAQKLHRLLRLKHRDLAQQRMIENFEEVLYPELALVLKKSVNSLRKKVRPGYTAPPRDESKIDPLDKTLEGWREVSRFRVFSGKIAVGERPYSASDAEVYGEARANIVASCKNGEMFALERQIMGEHGTELVIVERGQVLEIESHIKKVRSLGSVVLEGGTIDFLDEEVRDDRAYQKLIENGEQPGGRGVHLSLDGDGSVEVFGASDGEVIELFLIRF